MKKSEMYKTAQIAILKMEGLTCKDTLEILRELMDQEGLEKWKEDKAEEEKQEAKKNAET